MNNDDQKLQNANNKTKITKERITCWTFQNNRQISGP